MRHAHHVTCTCMVSARESGLVQPIDKSSNDSAKSFVTRSTGNRKAEVGVSRPRPQVLNGGGGHSLTHHPRSPTSYCASPARCQPFPGCFVWHVRTDRGYSYYCACQPSLLVDDSFVIGHFPLVSSATEQLPDRSDRLTGYPPTTTRDLGSERRNAAVAISRAPEARAIYIYPLR